MSRLKDDELGRRQHVAQDEPAGLDPSGIPDLCARTGDRRQGFVGGGGSMSDQERG